MFTCWLPVGLRSVSRDDDVFQNQIEGITPHEIEQFKKIKIKRKQQQKMLTTTLLE